MLSRLTRLPLRRCLHSLPPRSPHSVNRFGRAVGASALVAATYLTWRLTFDSHSIALDSATRFPATQQPDPSSASNPILSVTSESPSSSEPVSYVKRTPGSPDLLDETTKPPSTNVEPEPESEPEPEGAGSVGAFNPVTGEINWDCPCLGGMAHGPCGPQFREAFSCFVFSEEEPKGINCVEKFKAMQDCFREHPEVYGDEIMDDDDEEPAPASTTTEGALLASSNPNGGDTLPEPALNATKPKSRKEISSKTLS